MSRNVICPIMAPSAKRTPESNVGLTYHFKAAIQRFEVTPTRAATLYLVLGFAALYASDVLLVRYFEEPLLSRLQGLKGGVEVLVTTGLIFALTRGSRAPLEFESERMERQREELEVLHRILRHNLRNNLDVVLSYAELLQQSSTDEQLVQWCDDIICNVNDLLKYSEKTNQVQQISTKPVSTNDMAETIPRVINANRRLSEADDVSMSVPDQALVEANHMIDVAINELLTNAVQHNDPSDLSVSVTVDPDTGPISTTQIVIEDNGSGIPETELEVLSSRSENPLAHMSGLGLWMVQWTVRESDGTIEADTDETGTRITLSLPTAMEIPNGSMLSD